MTSLTVLNAAARRPISSLRLDRDRLDDDAGAFARGLHPLDHARQLLADLAGGDGEAAKRAGDAPGQAEREQQGETEAEDGGHHQDGGALLLAALDVGRHGGDVGHDAGLGVGHRTDPRVRRPDPLDRAADGRVAALEQVRKVAAHLVDLVVLGTGERVVEVCVRRGVGVALEVGAAAAAGRPARLPGRSRPR